ncbi:inositol monophosphatase family protein [Candidatus Nitronereus thalassa]|uniref:Inositol-1-monophosphatase n=1 Tax=Candidatus Nitronereus thalassa TaxID=3020898 RepID=A0ABU3K8I4_9BACT|nr:inositol monophosphatase family protein [Candidatus Nitronereus thalassa]MDT7042623.1 inositol monophosphatase family protein [Candidatus Nitronereus thalassa]
MSQSKLPPPSELQALKKVAIEAAQVGGEILQKYTKAGFAIEHKTRLSLVTDADKESERTIVALLKQAYPTHQILAEEEGIHSAQQSPYKWVIDPLDGTTNFTHGLPLYNVSIGLEYEGACIVGVVFDPTRPELFVGVKNEGATCNGQPIQVSRIAELGKSLLVTGFGYDIAESGDNLDEFCRFTLRTQGVRRTGTAAIDLCYVASGRFDGFWEMNLNPWDTAAGTVILGEAGGKVTSYDGAPYTIYSKQMVASNGLLHEAIIDVLGQSTKK